MSLNDKSKKELSDLAKKLKIKTNSKMDKKALIELIEKHESENKVHSVEKEIKQKEVLETILHPKEERITEHDLKDIQEAKSEMKEQSADESLEELVINHEEVKNNSKDLEFIKSIQAVEKKQRNDDFVFSEGYTGRESYNIS